MTHPVVADTGPLIGLARIEHLGLLRRLYEQIIVPPAVHGELALDSGRPGATVLSGAFRAGWITVEAVTDSALVRDLAQLLGPGEAEAVALAGQTGARFLLVDDARGRRVARSREIPVVGLAGVLLAGKSQGAIAAVGPVLEELANTGYRFSPLLIAGVLTRAGE